MRRHRSHARPGDAACAGITLGVLMLLAAGPARSQPEDPCKCGGTDQSVQYRTAAKHRKGYAHYARATRVIGPEEIVAWQSRFSAMTDTIGRSASSSRLKRLRHSPEDTLYTLKGYMYYIKKEEDCDYHVEIGPADPSAPRAVVEFTKEYCRTQRRIRRFLIAYVQKTRHKVLAEYNLKEEFSPGIGVTIKGLGFYDGWHEPDAHGRAHTHGSSWELHPAVQIAFEP